MANEKIEVNDIVSRDGTDRHKVISIDEEWGTMVVECIKEPTSKWIKKGERESNLVRRYELVKELR